MVKRYKKVPIKSTLVEFFNDHITSKLTTVDKLTSTLRKLYHYMPRDSLGTIYKSFSRPHPGYAVLYLLYFN